MAVRAAGPAAAAEEIAASMAALVSDLVAMVQGLDVDATASPSLDWDL